MAHPLDPLSPGEVALTADVCKQHFKALHPSADAGALLFNAVSLQEPPKKELVAFMTGAAAGVPARKGFALMQPPASVYTENEPYAIIEAVVDLGTKEVDSWVLVPGVEPLFTPFECFEAERIVKADPKVRALLEARYGIKHEEVEEHIAADPWSVHEHGELKGRLIQTFLYWRASVDDNAYSHPINMTPVVDLRSGTVVEIDAPEPALPINKLTHNYHRDLIETGFRADPPKPLNITQPEGPSFTVEGNLVKWQKWQFRAGFNYREGLVLHQLGFEDQGRVRPILHRLSVVEMSVPYAEPRAPYHRKNAFDISDYGMGFCTTNLSLGCDCLGHIHYWPATLSDHKGNPTVIDKAICMHEEDFGLLWKHVDYRTNHSESRRSRRLVISFLTTVVNYEYLHYFYLYQDGTVEYEVKLTGELSTNALSPGEDENNPDFGILVDPGVNAQHHQHMFCARIDPAIDDEEGGACLEVVEQEVEALEPDPTTNPYANAFRAKTTLLEDEHSAQRVANPFTARAWLVRNPTKKNRFGKPVAYKLIGAANPPILAHPSSLTGRKAQFATKSLWVTPYAEDEFYPAGTYPTQNNGGEGLPKWTAKNRNLVGKDLVLWHAFGLTHVVRMEDFPIMPVEHCGFKLKASSFFDRNPATDLPPECNKASVQNGVGAAAGSCCKNPSPN